MTPNTGSMAVGAPTPNQRIENITNNGQFAFTGTNNGSLHFNAPGNHPDPKRKSPRRSIVLIPFVQDPMFVKQDNIMENIGDAFGLQSRVALAGIGGIGKSQISIEYAFRYREKHPSHSVYWVYAANAFRFDQAYQNLFDKLRIPGGTDEKINFRKLVYDHLSDETNGSWLMILDNADDFDTFYAPPAATEHDAIERADFLPQCSHGKFLITTRDARLGQALSLDNDIIQIPELNLGEARVMMESHMKRKMSDTDEMVEELLQALDYLPLAISQAAAYIRSNKTSVPRYYELLTASEKSTGNMLEKQWKDPRRTGNNHAVFRTWEVSFKYIQSSHPRAAEMLSLMAVLDRQGIQESLVGEATEEDDIIIESLGTLQGFSLITMDTTGKSFTMHRLVQQAVQRWLERAHMLSTYQMRAVVHLSDRVPAGEYEFWPTWAQLSPHVRKVIEYQCSAEESLLNQASILNNFAWYEMRMANYEDALHYGTKAMNIRSQYLAADDVALLFTQSVLALTLGYLLRFDEALVLQEQILRTRSKKLGTIHKDTLNSTGNLAWLYTKKKNWVTARKLYTKVVSGRTELFGAEHRSTITAKGNLSEVLTQLHLIGDAVSLSAEAYSQAIVCRDFGDAPEMHPDTLGIMHQYIGALIKAGDLFLAEEIARKAFSGHLKIEGEAHPATLRSMLMLEEALSLQGKTTEASGIYLRALDGYNKMQSREGKAITDVHELREMLNDMR